MFFFLAAGLLGGFLAPFNLMFYSRNFLGDLDILDYIILGCSGLIGLLLIAMFQRYAKIILFLGEGTLLIANVVITNVISINSNNLTASGSFSLLIFGESITLARITLPLVLFIFSGLFMLGATMDLVSFSDLFNQKTKSERSKFLGLSISLAFILNSIIRAININSVDSIFLIAPTGIILSTYSYAYLRFKGKILSYSQNLDDNNNKNKNFSLGISKPKRGFALSICKGILFSFFSIIVTLNLIIANLSVFPLANLNDSISLLVLTLLSSAIGCFGLIVLLNYKSIQRNSKSDPNTKNDNQIKFLLILVSILFCLPIFSFILSYHPDISYNLIVTSIIYGLDMGLLVFFLGRMIADKTDMPGTVTAFSFLLLIIVGYISRTPLYRAEVWAESVIFLPILAVCLIIAIFTTWLILKIPDKFSSEGSK